MSPLPRRPRFGVAIPFYSQHLGYDNVVEFATTAQRLGFDGLWLSDHLVVGPPPELSRTWYDAPTLLAGLAGQVPDMTLGTDVLIAGFRHPVTVAKSLVTLDIVCGGRLVVGVGVGHDPSEFAVLGAEFADRGAVADEYLQVWRSVWGAGPTKFAGRHFSVDEPELLPKPVQQSGPPILIGGNSARAIRRAALHGDGWHPLGLPPALYADGAKRLADLAAYAGQPAPMLSYSGFFGDVVASPVDEATRVPLTGGVDQIVDDIGKFAEIGVSNIVFRLGAAHLSSAQVLEQLHRVASDVLPKVS